MTNQRKTLIAGLLVQLIGFSFLVASIIYLKTEPHQATHEILFWLSVAFIISGAFAYVIAGRFMKPTPQEKYNQ